MRRSFFTLQLIYHILKRAITDEPYYIMMLLPERKRILSDNKYISLPMMHDAMHLNLEFMERNDLAPVKLTDNEAATIDDKD